VEDVEAVVAGVGDLEVMSVDVTAVAEISENVWAATLFWEVKVTPTGSSTPDPSAAFARFAWQATGKVVWVGSSLDITYPYSPEGSTENALPEEMPDKSAQILRNRASSAIDIPKTTSFPIEPLAWHHMCRNADW
jgi:hypothetical protein